MPFQLTIEQWHRRFEQQARWTQDVRRYLFAKADLAGSRGVLDVGCGTGALLGELCSQTRGEVYGLDISTAHLELAMRRSPVANLIQGDAHAMPFPSHTFDIALCHFVLLWVSDPLQVVCEMGRIVRPGGQVLALAEPDYDGRIDYPDRLARLGSLQRESLRHQGAQPGIGRRLRAIFHQAGLIGVESGALGGQWASPPSQEEWRSEWDVLEADLAHFTAENLDLKSLKSQDWDAWQMGERVLYVPTFYASGVVPG